MKKKEINQLPNFIKIPERSETVKEMLSPEVLIFCAQSPRNGYPVGDPCHHFHLTSESGLTEDVLADIYTADKKRIYKGVEHVFAILPDDEYAEIHEKSIKCETPIITRVFTMDVTATELASLGPSTLLELLDEPLVNPRNEIEIVRFVPKSAWDDEAEKVLEEEDQVRGTSGVISHYISIVEDDDLNEIYDPILESILTDTDA